MAAQTRDTRTRGIKIIHQEKETKIILELRETNMLGIITVETTIQETMEHGHSNNRIETSRTIKMDPDRAQVLGGNVPHIMRTHGDNHQINLHLKCRI